MFDLFVPIMIHIPATVRSFVCALNNTVKSFVKIKNCVMASELPINSKARAFQLVSDIHLEHCIHNPSIPKYARNLILAGDICPLSRDDLLEPFIMDVSERFENVIYVLGNHEYYADMIGSNEPAKHVLHPQMWNLDYFPPNVHVLENQTVTIDGVKILGTTLWSEIADEDRSEIWQEMNDYRWICMAPNKLLTVDDVNMMNYQAKAFLRREAEDGCIIVTHHAPMPQCLTDDFAGTVLGTAYANQFQYDPLLLDKKVAAWCYGHTHHAKDFKFLNTRIVSNPMGYPQEVHTGYKSDVVIEV